MGSACSVFTVRRAEIRSSQGLLICLHRKGFIVSRAEISTLERPAHLPSARSVFYRAPGKNQHLEEAPSFALTGEGK